jgi:hypothetical protein
MSEPIWCDVRIKIPHAWWPTAEDVGADESTMPWFVERIGLYDGNTDVDAGDGFWIVTVNGLGNYGHYDTEVEPVLNRLVELRIPHSVHDEAKYECAAEDFYFDGTEAWGGTSSAGEPVLTAGQWKALRAAIPETREPFEVDQELVENVEAHFKRMTWTVEEADISHLPAERPKEPT